MRISFLALSYTRDDRAVFRIWFHTRAFSKGGNCPPMQPWMTWVEKLEVKLVGDNVDIIELSKPK